MSKCIADTCAGISINDAFSVGTTRNHTSASAGNEYYKLFGHYSCLVASLLANDVEVAYSVRELLVTKSERSLGDVDMAG